MMRLDVLGSSGTAPSRDNPASGFLVSEASTTSWMDAGPGTYMALLGLIDPGDIDAVLISHMHADHCTDLFAFFHGLKYIHGAPEQVRHGEAPVPRRVYSWRASSLSR